MRYQRRKKQLCGPRPIKFNPDCDKTTGRLNCKCPASVNRKILKNGAITTKKLSILVPNSQGEECMVDALCASDFRTDERTKGYCNHKNDAGNRCELVQKAGKAPTGVKCTCKKPLKPFTFNNVKKMSKSQRAQRLEKYSGKYCEIFVESACADAKTCSQDRHLGNKCQPTDLVKGSSFECKCGNGWKKGFGSLSCFDCKTKCRTDISGNGCRLEDKEFKCICGATDWVLTGNGGCRKEVKKTPRITEVAPSASTAVMSTTKSGECDESDCPISTNSPQVKTGGSSIGTWVAGFIIILVVAVCIIGAYLAYKRYVNKSSSLLQQSPPAETNEMTKFKESS